MYPRHIRIEFGGSLTARAVDDEIWSCSLRAFPGATGGPANLSDGGASLDLQAWCAAVAPQLSAWFGKTSAPIVAASTAKISYVKANVIGPDGKYLSSSVTNVQTFTPVAGGGGGIAPSFTTVASSFGSDRARGAASRGRIFLPNYIYSPTGAAITNAQQSTILSGTLALIALVKAQTAGLNGGVMTPALVSDVDALWSYIRTVRVGNLYDVQRRRKNAASEVYVAGGVSA